MGLVNTTTNLSYARNELIKVGESFIFDKVADMIYYMAANDDIATATTTAFAMGTSGSPISYTAGSPAFKIYATSSNTTSTNAEPFYVKSVMTGDGGYGGRARFHAFTEADLQTNFMALKCHTEFGDSGTIAGLATALCAEIELDDANVGAGGVCCLELEYVAGGTSTVTGGSLTGSYGTFIYMNSSNDAAGDFDNNCFLFSIQGLTDSSGNVLYRNTLRLGVGTTNWYLPLSSAQGTYTTAYPIISSSTTGFRSTATFVPDSGRSNYAFALGFGHTATNELDVTMGSGNDQNLDPFAMNVNIIGSNPGNSSTTNLMYAKLTHDAGDKSNLRLKCTDFTVAVAKNVKDVYVYQGEIDITGNCAIGSEVCALGLVVNISSGTVTGAVRGIVIAMDGNSTPTTNSMGLFIATGTGCDLYDGIYIETQGGTSIHNSIRLGSGSGTTITNGINIEGAGTFTTGITVGSNCTTGISVDSETDASGTTDGSIHTDGGVGIAKKLYVGGTSNFTGTITSAAISASGLLTSTSTTGFRSNPTFVPDNNYTNYGFSVGNKAAELDITFAQSADQNMNPIQAVINCKATGSGPTDASQINVYRAHLTHDTNEMLNLRLKCADFYTEVGVSCTDVYCYQGEIGFTAGSITISNEVCVAGFVLNAGSSAVTNSAWRVVNCTLRGSGTPANSVGIMINAEGSTHALGGIEIRGTGMHSAILIGAPEYDEAPMRFVDFPAAGTDPVIASANSGAGAGSIKIRIGGADKYMQYWDAAT